MALMTIDLALGGSDGRPDSWWLPSRVLGLDTSIPLETFWSSKLASVQDVAIGRETRQYGLPPRDFTGNRPDMAVLWSLKQPVFAWNTCQILPLRRNACDRFYETCQIYIERREWNPALLIFVRPYKGFLYRTIGALRVTKNRSLPSSLSCGVCCSIRFLWSSRVLLP
jgi:hypothetical protein